MHDEIDPLIERMREEAKRLAPPFSTKLHERLVKGLENERAALTESKNATAHSLAIGFSPWMAVAAAVLIACSGYFALSGFLHRHVPLIRTVAKSNPATPDLMPLQPAPKSTQLQPSTRHSVYTFELPRIQSAPLQPTVIRPVSSQPVAVLSVAPAVVIQPICKQSVATQPGSNQRLAMQPVVKLPTAVQPTAAQPVTIRPAMQQPVEVESALQVAASQMPLERKQFDPLAGMLRDLNHVAPVKFLPLPVNVFSLDKRATVDRHATAGLDSAIVGTVGAVSNQMGNIFNSLQPHFGRRR